MIRTQATTTRKRASRLPPLSPVLGGEGSGVRGLRQTPTRSSPLTPDPSPPSTGERGGKRGSLLHELIAESVLRRSLCCHLLIGCLLLSASPAGAEEIRLTDNTTISGMIEEVTNGAEPALKVATIDGATRSIPLARIVTINFHGREPRLVLAGTQELRFHNGDRIRGRFVRNTGDRLILETWLLGELQVNLDHLKGFVTLPQVGRVGRLAEEMVEDQQAAGKEPFLDQVLDRRGSAYKGVIRKISSEGIDIDHDALFKVVPIPTAYLAGVRLAAAGRQPAPKFPTDPILRVSARDGSRVDGWLDKIALDRWQLRPTWDPEAHLALLRDEITAVQILNSNRLYLSQLTPVRVKETTTLAPPQPYRMDRSCQGDTLSIGKHTYPWGIGVHANSELTFHIGKTFKSFQAVVGIDSHSGQAGSVVFVVLGDGKELYKSPVVRGRAEPLDIAVSVEGVSELTLKVTDAGDLDVGDTANWALAQLLR